MTTLHRRLAGSLGALLCTSVLVAAPAAAQSLDQVWKGDKLRVVSGFGSGSGYTVWARMLGPHWARNLPGQPTVIVQSMVGAGGLLAANHMYTVAPKDGREIAAVAREAPALSIIGKAGANYDATRFAWLGSPTSESNICVLSRSVPFERVEDLFSREIVLGTDGVGSGMHIFPMALNAVLGTRFKTVDGYADSGLVLLAIDRGEVQGACQSVETLSRARGAQLKSGELRVVLQGGLAPHPAFPGVPFVLDLARTDEQRQTLHFLYSSQAFGRPFLAPPGTPADRVAALRSAFDATMKDPAFLDEVAKAKMELSPITGSEMQAMVERLAATPKPIVEKAKALLDPPRAK
jgi:tripartite-type tricarboxylate transporter receptor subunit TctC